MGFGKARRALMLRRLRQQFDENYKSWFGAEPTYDCIFQSGWNYDLLLPYS
jgi:hypothetical protein